MNFSRFPIICLAVLTISACASTKEESDVITDFETGDVLGMIYDSENRPCYGALIIVDEGPRAIKVRSDINGRFLIPELPGGLHTLVATKEGFESNVYNLDYASRKQVLYIRLTSLDTLLDSAESSLDALEWSDAAAFLERAGVIDDRDSRYQTLMGVYSYRIGENETAVSYWENLASRGHRNPFLYLMLADAYQLKLDDPETAAVWLAKYLDTRDDPGAQRRLDELIGVSDIFSE